MPHINGELVPDTEAYAKGLCPECAAPLKDANLQAHAEFHYGSPDERDVRNKRALERKAAILRWTPGASYTPTA